VNDTSKVKFERSEKFYKQVEVLSTYISDLGINKMKNDELVNLIIKQLELTERDAFSQGFKAGLNYNLDQILKQAEQNLNANEV
jgi:hypothetical protein